MRDRDLQELDYDIAQIIETPYAGCSGYLMGVVRLSYVLGTSRVNNITPSDSHPHNIFPIGLKKLDYGIGRLIETP